MNNRRYRGKRGLTGEQAIVFAVFMIVAMLALTIHANSHWTGKSAEEQVHQAIFEAKDWD